MSTNAAITAEELSKKIEAADNLRIIDVRRKADYEQSPETIEGAVWRDPEKFDEWGKELPRDKVVVFYCVKGGEISQNITESVQERIPGARYLEGGIRKWQEQEK